MKFILEECKIMLDAKILSFKEIGKASKAGHVEVMKVLQNLAQTLQSSEQAAEWRREIFRLVSDRRILSVFPPSISSNDISHLNRY